MINKIDISRASQSAIKNLWRNKALTIATLIIITLIVFIFNIILTIHSLTESSISEVNKKVDIILYLSDNIDYLTVTQFINEVETYPEVETVNYTSKKDALDSILLKYPSRGDPFEEYGIDNPLPASVTIVTYNPLEHQTVIDKINQSQYGSLFSSLESNQDNIEVTQKLVSISQFTKKLLLTILISFAIGATLIITNALNLTIKNRSQEISIQKLVGANLSFIRLPYIIEGIVYGLISACLSLALSYLFLRNTDLLQLNLSTFSINFYQLAFWQLFTCIVISVSASLIAIQRYIQKIPL